MRIPQVLQNVVCRSVLWLLVWAVQLVLPQGPVSFWPVM